MSDEKTEVLTVTDKRAASQPREPQATSLTPTGQLVSDVLTRIADPDKGMAFARELIALQREEEERQAARALTRAMTKFRAVVPAIPRDASGQSGTVKTRYTSLGKVAECIRPGISVNGLNYGWDEVDTGTGPITVTCWLEHEDGGRKTLTKTAPPDDSKGSMTTIQRRASTSSYLRRYTLTGLLGLASEDNDGGNGRSDPPPKHRKADPPPPQTERRPDPIADAVDWMSAKFGILQSDMERMLGGKDEPPVPVAEWGDAELAQLRAAAGYIQGLPAEDRAAGIRGAFLMGDE